jgi:site-specific DNA-methyltransferase (adenine-specific)
MAFIPDGSVDAIICDLPYGTTACKWDTVIPFEPLWTHYKRVIKPNGAIVLFGSQPFTSALVMSNVKMFKYSWVWKSNKAANFAQAPYMPLKNLEDVVVFSKATIAQNSKNRMKYNPQGLVDIDKICQGKKANDHRPNRADQKPYQQTKTGYPTALLEYDKEARPIHPTQKPVALLEYLIRTYTRNGETVLDNCFGSGTTGIACLNTGRNFIGIEKDPAYFEIARNRIDGHNVELG